MRSPLTNKIDIIQFLELSEILPVADVRSPSEYRSGHIPAAVNIPLFKDDERAAVGIKYKKEGRTEAILEGLKHAGPAMSEKLEQALKLAGNKRLLVHCWRGGMRSEAMAWLFSLAGIETEVLEGGYKSYRNYILDNLSGERKIIVLGGLTGSGKTHILRRLKEHGHQVLDLEGLASHKGSAFGSLGQPEQPSTEHFANLLFNEWKRKDSNLPIWVEDESRNIGTVFLPERFYLSLQDSPIIILQMDIKIRIPRLMQEYSVYSPELLKSSVLKISKRLGGDYTKEALNSIESGDIGKAIEITLGYYDKAYMFGLKKKNGSNIIYINAASDDIETNTMSVIEAAGKITWPSKPS